MSAHPHLPEGDEPRTGPGRQARAVRLGPRSVAALVLVSAIGVMAFGWPLLADSASGLAHSRDAPWLFAALLPMLLAVVVATIADTGLDAKAIAMLGVLAAAGAAMRPLGAGTAGIEPMFFLMVLSGRVLGPGFGFVLGSVAMFASALLTGGVGPWMPFQMLSMGWVSMGAGLLPGAMGDPPARAKPRAWGRLRGRRELAVLAAYGAVSALLYGLVMNLQGWPYIGGMASGVSFVPGDPLDQNLARYLAYCLATSLGWDVPRALVTVLLTCTLGGTVLKALRRATRRAAFDVPVSFPSEPAGGKQP
ncbi:energy-coupling factor transport system substrate-specific component [Streptomyces sp. 2224.1]|uniref:ECF transporter S component n=1 Tax=unclassified Streptomyces TaxID=2593676 RepID=UPI000897603C|nr:MULTISPECIES: ECF transporter S component [unclassified Streptomyces]PBC82149.1 energy-coupling factor transport system substrate-specific component [Streptomyces sp. 2321.6]SEC45593.1 energy-coupling factor transport system substrate-specific component [Streptomyces sp. 2133.1]SEC58270.1 energy-coupling factor transport system substrate-specific component [Streptomyces sp. 2224.1]SEF01292.1 energy-coupling factor transport system substrate-specific component [Streptomyces sp. 2112.3]SNC675